jgi:hypothetical protein
MKNKILAKLADFITIHGDLGRRKYFVLLIELTIAYYSLLVLATLIVIIVSSLINVNETTVWSQLVAIIYIITIVLATVFTALSSLFLILRRARQTNLFILWLIVGVIMPFGSIVIGFIPANKA